jgi:hypothetical protein
MTEQTNSHNMDAAQLAMGPKEDQDRMGAIVATERRLAGPGASDADKLQAARMSG